MKENNKSNFFKNFMIVIVTALITCVLTTIWVYNVIKRNIGTSSENAFMNNIVKFIANPFTQQSANEEEDLEEKINEIDAKLEDLYIGDIDKNKLMESALEGYVAGLGDEYSEYLTEKEVKSLLEDVNGSYVGVGLYIGQNAQNNNIVVVGVIQDSPANKAGILIGDIVKKVDGVAYTGEQLSEASNKMKGIEGTEVKVIVERDGKEIEYTIKREKIKFKCVDSQKLENNIGYIKISSFDGGVAEDFKAQYDELQKQGIKGLIIDLRNNGGGLVDQSLEIAEQIVPKGSKMLITKDKKSNESISTNTKEPTINVPIVILVNEYTASASEILTAAVKENVDTCKVVGTKTFGKGIIQGIYSLKDQKTALKVTIQEYFTPKYNKIHKVGITPDIVLELPEDWKGQLVVDKEYDNQLNKAIEILK